MIFDEIGLAAWGRRVGRAVQPPVFFALRGDLGAGKSVLARAIAQGAGVHGPMPSPTFNLVLRYESPEGRVISHIDLFRLEQADDVWELGWSELGGPGEITIVEWPERAESLLPDPRWEIKLEMDIDPDRRRVAVEAIGQPPAIPEPA